MQPCETNPQRISSREHSITSKSADHRALFRSECTVWSKIDYVARWYLIERREDTERECTSANDRKRSLCWAKRKCVSIPNLPTLKHPREIRIKLNDRVSAVRVGRNDENVVLFFRSSCIYIYIPRMCVYMYVCTCSSEDREERDGDVSPTSKSIGQA